MGIKGDDKALADLIRRFRVAGRGALRRPLLLGAQHATEQLVQKEFQRERDPEGEAWAPTLELQRDQQRRGLKRISGKKRKDTQAAREQMRRDLKYSVEGRYFWVRGTHKGDGFFNYGTRHQLPRPYLPPFELPRGWQRLYVQEGRQVLIQHLRPERATPDPWAGGSGAG